MEKNNYVWPFSDGFPPGSRVLIEGIPRLDVYDINFLTKLPHEVEEWKADIAFHVSVRYGAGCIVNNSFLVCGGWQEEERHEITSVNAGRPFKIVIVSTDTHFCLYVNGHHFANFLHRMPLERVECVSVAGSVDIKYMVVDKIRRVTWPLHNGFPVNETVTVKGVPGIYRTSHEFSIKIKNSLSSEKPGDVIFSMLARLKEGKAIISTYESGRPRDEEKSFVLERGKEFTVKITNGGAYLDVKRYSDGNREATENFTVNSKFSCDEIKYLIIEDNVDVSLVMVGNKKC